jgi:hypothetical protein
MQLLLTLKSRQLTFMHFYKGFDNTVAEVLLFLSNLNIDNALL